MSEMFLAGVAVSRHRSLPEVNLAWLVGVARHKLVATGGAWSVSSAA